MYVTGRREESLTGLAQERASADSRRRLGGEGSCSCRRDPAQKDDSATIFPWAKDNQSLLQQ